MRRNIDPFFLGAVGALAFLVGQCFFTPVAAELDPTKGPASVMPHYLAQYTEECIANSIVAPYVTANSGASSSASSVGEIPEAGHPGTWQFVTGSTSTGRAMISPSSLNYLGVLLNGGQTTSEAVLKLSALSDATDTYIVYAGLSDMGSADLGNDGVFFQYSSAVNSGNWQLIARANNVQTTTNTTTAPTAATWMRLTIVVAAGGASAEGFVNGVSVGTVTGIPTGAGRQTGIGVVKIEKTVGTANRYFDLDYLTYRQAVAR